ncbi:MAG: response regulator [Burkholderiales bacterium]|nr:response regulator [Burkholderiales bacterium]
MNTSDLILALRSEVESITGDLSAFIEEMAGGGARACGARDGYRSQIERLAATASLLGMGGLEICCGRVNAALCAAPSADAPLSGEEREFLGRWPELVVAYLADTGDKAACAALAGHFSVGPGGDREAADLAARLSEPPRLAEEMQDAAKPSRPSVAAAEDVSLELPADLDPGMFDGFMQEAPGHATEFSVLVGRIAAGRADAGVLREAKRIAHTFKGSANIVGIRGIAKLGHYTEDILEHLQEHPGSLSPELADALLDVAGCLEQMVGCLQGQEEYPANAQSVMQAVLDWANRIDGVAPAAAVPAVPVEDAAPAAQPVPAAQSTATPAAPAPAGQSLRVPVKVLDDLFRHVGELSIKVGQLQSALRRVTIQSGQLIHQNVAIQKRIFELENLVDVKGFAGMQGRRDASPDGFDSLELDQYNELHMVTRALAEEAADAREIGQEIERGVGELAGVVLQQDRIRRDLQHLALSTRMAPVRDILPRLMRNVRQTCRSTGKEAELVLEGGDTMLDGEILNRLADPLLHILRNAIDHGIEPPGERELVGKPRAGEVRLAFSRSGQGLVVRCTDDGRGLDHAAIRARAIERGLISADQILEPGELARLIMLPGFSTRDTVSEISGRGVGLDVVRERVLSMKGGVDIHSGGADRGTTIELRVPASMTALHVLLVEAAGQVFGLPSYGIERAVAPGAGEQVLVAGRPHLKAGDGIYPVRMLAELVGGGGTEFDAARQAAVLMRTDDSVAALVVDRVVEARDLIAKDLGQCIRSVKGLSGAAVLGDGAVAPLLDVAAMLREPSREAGAAHPGRQEAAGHPGRTRLVVVDDSLSVRRLLVQLLEDNGYAVEAAKDGMEAIALIESFRPHAVLTDLEMPNMNGLELTAHLRGRQDTRDLPVIMITSRSLDKHRRQAELSGVSAYLTKPYSDHELLSHLHAQLEGGHHAVQNTH